MKAKILFIRKIRDLSQYKIFLINKIFAFIFPIFCSEIWDIYIYIGLININEICIFIYIMIKISFFPYKYKHVVVMC